ncbi:MAG: CRTAC1 family protein [Caldilineaceae bacterium]|nr:CRTAC1 family protein [Caldilineaceae bacterium]
MNLFHRYGVTLCQLLLILVFTCSCTLNRDEPSPGTGYNSEQAFQPTVSGSNTIPVTRSTTPLTTPTSCSEQFIAHDLAHVTTTDDGVIRAFAANGAGVAVGDLDQDGDEELIFGAEAGPNHIFWNEGGLAFQITELGQGPTRAVTVVDVDGDGRRDIVTTTNRGSLNYWHNEANRAFTRQVLPGVAYPAYAINWGDLDQDGDLDLVTASYDAGFLTDIGSEYLLSDVAGVYVYENRAGTFRPTRLASEAQALTLALPDLNQDGRQDIVVGNDFAVPDFVWLWSKMGWQATEPFRVTAYSTMSLDVGDVDNNGTQELLAADMSPYDITPATLAQWLPVINRMQQGARLVNDPQTMTNVLQVQAGERWREEATDRGIGATGWSWTSRFGDLDNDGYLDLYVVNGMIELGTFGHLPNHELVEENQALRNDGRGYFVPMPTWQLNSRRSGRSMVMADLDLDGDLDIVVNNLRGAAQLFENQLCGGQSVQIALRWPTVQNQAGIGAQLVLHTSLGPLVRDVRAASGYLSGDAPVVHLGMPVGTTIERLDVLWPDGAHSSIPPIIPNQRIVVIR